MSNENFPPKKIINAVVLSLMVSLVIFIAACTGDTTTGDGTTNTTEPTTLTPADAPLSQDFHHLRIDSAVVVDSFFKKIAAPPFKKILFNFKINDYSDFPRSITLIGHGAKENDDLIDFNPEELTRLANREPVSIDNLFYSTMELSRTKIERLIGNPLSPNPAQRKSFTHLVFIPYIDTTNGQRHLSYKVQARPIDPNADVPEEGLNPCPPFKPND